MLTIYEVIKHLQYYNLPLLQRQIIRILIMLPIYGIGSALSLSVPSASLYLATVRDVYEAFVIHCFLQLMLDYPGGEAKVVEGISDKPKLRQPVPCCCLPRLRLDHGFIIWCKRMTLQFVIVKPLIGVLSLVFMNIPLPPVLEASIAESDNEIAHGTLLLRRALGALAATLGNSSSSGGGGGAGLFAAGGGVAMAAARRLSGGGGGHHDFTGTLYASDVWQYILLVVYNTSYTLALYYLLLFYMATKTLLYGFHPGERHARAGACRRGTPECRRGTPEAGSPAACVRLHTARGAPPA